MQKIISNLLTLLPSHLRVQYEYNYRKFYGLLEEEFLYLENFNFKCNSYTRAIDIGANKGIYSYFLSQIFEVVEVFEPQPWCTNALKKYAKKYHKNIRIYNCGLSNQDNTLILNIPYIQGRLRKTLATGVASFKEQNKNCQKFEVPVYCLDKFNFTDIGFIKIDVEGHERQVIEGAKKTLIREKPIMLIEIEQRHLDDIFIETIFKQIHNLGYRGKFLKEGNWNDVENFSYKEDQQAHASNVYSKNYINNFLFVPVESLK